MPKHIVYGCVGILAAIFRSPFQPAGVSLRAFNFLHEASCDSGIRLLVVHYMGTNSSCDLIATSERRIGSLKMQQHPKLEAGNRNGLTNRQWISGASGQRANTLPRTIKALMPIAIEHAENCVISAKFPALCFRTLNDADGCRSDCVVGEDDLSGGQTIADTRSIEIGLLRFTLADDEGDGSGRLVSRCSPKRVSAARP